jgi:hypothetical protein
MTLLIKATVFALALGGTILRGASDCCCEVLKPVCPAYETGCHRIDYQLGTSSVPAWINGVDIAAPPNLRQCFREELYDCFHSVDATCYTVAVWYNSAADCAAQQNPADTMGGVLKLRVPACATTNCPM